jgi:MscS family membrane protein
MGRIGLPAINDMLQQYLDGWGLNWVSALISQQFTRYIIGVLLILVLFWVIKKLVKKYLFPWVERLTGKSQNEMDDKIAAAFFRPVEWLIALTGWFMVLRYLPLSPNLDQILVDIYRSAIIALIAWGFYVLAAGESILYREFKEKFKIDDILIAFLSKVLRFIIIALALVVIVQEWGYEVNGFIAGLGLGGLAFALAAQDALSNIFGGIVIIMEKPFSIGDCLVHLNRYLFSRRGILTVF